MLVPRKIEEDRQWRGLSPAFAHRSNAGQPPRDLAVRTLSPGEHYAGNGGVKIARFKRFHVRNSRSSHKNCGTRMAEHRRRDARKVWSRCLASAVFFPGRRAGRSSHPALTQSPWLRRSSLMTACARCRANASAIAKRSPAISPRGGV